MNDKPLLPAIVLEVNGQVIASNLRDFRIAARNFIDGINMEPVTDDDFAEAEAAAKACKEAEVKLAEAKQKAITSMASVSEVFGVIDEIVSKLEVKRRALEKSVKARKENLRDDLIAVAVGDLMDHCESLRQTTGYLVRVSVQPIRDAVKNKKLLSTCQEAVNNALAGLKKEVTDTATRMAENRKLLVRDGVDWISLFPDFETQVGMSSTDQFKALADSRIGQQLAMEAERRAREAERRAREAEQKAREEARRMADEEARIARDRVQAEREELRRQAEERRAKEEARLAEEQAEQWRAEQEAAAEGNEWLPDGEPITREALTDTLSRMSAAVKGATPIEPVEPSNSAVVAFSHEAPSVDAGQTENTPQAEFLGSSDYAVVDVFMASRNMSPGLRPILCDFVDFYEQTVF